MVWPKLAGPGGSFTVAALCGLLKWGGGVMKLVNLPLWLYQNR